MRVACKQRNSRKCIICGLDNPYGVKASFYSMEDGSVYSKFRYQENHQSYPGRVHGGMITSMLDELGLRALWALHNDESLFGVTIKLDTKFAHPVPYNEELLAVGKIVKETDMFCTCESKIYNLDGLLLASGNVYYMKMDVNKIAADIDYHDEMPYLIEDDVKEINIGK